ncbi:MAG: hypothetical protein JOZ68_17030 [Acidimicrobiia bacterium]|nr:hypothetical protein [Acidimicrobiia bacterium]MBV9042709.1 hypothetical protein [Acidimicrobiia bacterium]
MTDEPIGEEVVGRARLEHLAVIVQEMIEAYDQNEWDRLNRLQERACFLLGALDPPDS